jgi:hypothetical protein
MPWGAAIAAGAAVVGSSMQADATENAAEKAGKIDPRMDKYIYGDGTINGLLGDSYNLYQGNKSGMNDQMRQGLNQQWATYTDPSTMAGYRQMSNLGSGLMGAPVMGNPFSDGRVSLMTQQQRPGMGGLMSGQPQLGGGQSQYPSYQPVVAPPSPGGLTGPFTAPPPPSAPAPVAAPKDDGRFTMTPTGYEQFYMDPGGNMFRKDAFGGYSNVHTADYGTGNGGA